MKLSRSATLALLLVATALFPAGCIFSPDQGGPPPPPDFWADTSPENVIHNIAACYIARSTVRYEEVLATGYVFRFLRADITTGDPDSLTRPEEMNFAEHLFDSGKPEQSLLPATKISLRTVITSHDADARFGHAGWMKYVVETDMTLDFANGDKQTIAAPALWYFRQQPDSSGHWKLAEWEDQPSGSSGAPSRNDSKAAASGSSTTWAALRSRYR